MNVVQLDDRRNLSEYYRMSLRARCIAAAVGSLVACSDDTSSPGRASIGDAAATFRPRDSADSAPLSPSDAGMTPASAGSFTSPPAAIDPGCGVRLAGTLTVIPSPQEGDVNLFQPIGGDCEQVGPAEAILQNSSPSVVRVEELSMNDPLFSVSASGLPRDLQPSERIPIALNFLGRGPGEHAAYLVAKVPDGCIAFRVLGQAVDANQDSVIVYSPLAMDFGHIPVGSQSSRKFTFVVQDSAAPGRGPTNLGAFGVSPEAFTIEGPTEVGASEGSCHKFQVVVGFRAPPTPGLIRGQVSWSFSASVNGSSLEASAQIVVLGNGE